MDCSVAPAAAVYMCTCITCLLMLLSDMCTLACPTSKRACCLEEHSSD